MMMAKVHDTTLSAPVAIGHTTESWYARIKTWWTARHDGRPADLTPYWDARREAVRTLRADAALDMVPQTHVHTAVRAYCALAL
jgi:hypothetical protein